MFKQKYSVTSVVCHSGAGASSGHYLTIKMEDGVPIICDDSLVLPLDKYCKHYSLDEIHTLDDFCKHMQLSGYLYAMKAVSA